ncbi:hypothetical protein HanRHA438_Chr13g0624301 [Helianthus annuus]|nr:hypothetical protein HanRHA438_Chr13g0624301 [Helianthus annuus]
MTLSRAPFSNLFHCHQRRNGVFKNPFSHHRGCRLFHLYCYHRCWKKLIDDGFTFFHKLRDELGGEERLLQDFLDER